MNNKDGRANNARLKYKYIEETRKADGSGGFTIRKIESSIRMFEEFIEYQDFGIYNKTIGEKFVIELKKRKNRNGIELSLKTIGFHIDAVKNFIRWVRLQRGYRSKIIERDIDYLRLSKKEINQMRSHKVLPDLPNVSDIRKQIDIIPKETELNRRDRAIFAFLFCTGIRATALITTPLEAFDPKKLFINQNPELNVQTKNSEHIISKIFNRDDMLIEEIIDWYLFLKEEKKFELKMPLFPKTGKKHGWYNHFANISGDYWKSQSGLSRMMMNRHDEQKTKYFSPHSYRHSAILHATDKCITPGEFKAVSQNFGHRDVMTTLMTYGNLPQREVMNKMNIIDHRDMEYLNSILKNFDTPGFNQLTYQDNSLVNDMVKLLAGYGYVVQKRIES